MKCFLFMVAAILFVNADALSEETNSISITNQSVVFQGGASNRNIGINNGTVNTYITASNVTLIYVGTNVPPVAFPVDPQGKIAELKRVAQTHEFFDVMKPFITPGYGQPKTISNFERDSVKRPVSYNALLSAGCLAQTVDGQRHLIAFGIKPGLDRPAWPMKSSFPPNWQKNDYYRGIVEKAQEYLVTYGPEMVELKMLSD